jgi:hypothetical protein
METHYYVKLTYFKANGKFYSTASYVSTQPELFRIWEEVALMQSEGKLPGLVEGARMPIIWVKVPMHPHRHPHLVIDKEMRST